MHNLGLRAAHYSLSLSLFIKVPKNNKRGKKRHQHTYRVYSILWKTYPELRKYYIKKPSGTTTAPELGLTGQGVCTSPGPNQDVTHQLPHPSPSGLSSIPPQPSVTTGLGEDRDRNAEAQRKHPQLYHMSKSPTAILQLPDFL